MLFHTDKDIHITRHHHAAPEMIVFQKGQDVVGYTHRNEDGTRQDCDLLGDGRAIHTFYDARDEIVSLKCKDFDNRIDLETTRDINRALFWMQLGDNLKALCGFENRPYRVRIADQEKKIGQRFLAG